MPNRLIIDDSSVFDNLEEKQVEFSGEVDGDDYDFAVQYDVIEALSGDAPDGDAAETFRRLVDPISDAALTALGRGQDAGMILVGEDDLV